MDHDKLTALETSIENLLNSNESITALIQGLNDESSTIKESQRKALIDTYLISLFPKDLKAIEPSTHPDAFKYNKQLSKMFKQNRDLEHIIKEYEQKHKLVILPDFKISKTTLQQFDMEGYQQYKTINNANTINIRDIFTVDEHNDDKKLINFESFKRLVNLEYRNKLERMIKYEILLSIKRDITGQNKKWGARSRELDKFINGDLKKIIHTVNEIKNENNDDEMDIDEDNEQDQQDDEDDGEKEGRPDDGDNDDNEGESNEESKENDQELKQEMHIDS